MNYISLTQTGETGIINNIHTVGTGGINLQDNSNNILTISNVGDVSCNSLHTTNLYIGGNSTIFRVVPWTVYKNQGNRLTDVVYTARNNGTIDMDSPVAATGSNWSYSYSIIGNTMYVNFHYNVVDGSRGTTSTGNYIYKIPPNYTINTNILYTNNYYGQANSDFGSQVGTCTLSEYGNRGSLGPVRITTLDYNNQTYLYLMDYIERTTPHSSWWFSYANTYNNITFEASFPII